jgi:hypothetical protein
MGHVSLCQRSFYLYYFFGCTSQCGSYYSVSLTRCINICSGSPILSIDDLSLTRRIDICSGRTSLSVDDLSLSLTRPIDCCILVAWDLYLLISKQLKRLNDTVRSRANHFESRTSFHLLVV